MMLQQPRLLENLREFGDVDYSLFRGFPATREQARHEWARAFADYLSTVEEDLPRPPPPADTHPSLDLSAVEGAFFADLDLAETMSSAVAAADFAGAWRQAILAITATVSGATDSAGAIYVFLSFTDVDTRHDALESRLAVLFSTGSAQAVPQLSEIATAFHDATNGLTASMNVTVGSTTSGTTVRLR